MTAAVLLPGRKDPRMSTEDLPRSPGNKEHANEVPVDPILWLDNQSQEVLPTSNTEVEVDSLIDFAATKEALDSVFRESADSETKQRGLQKHSHEEAERKPKVISHYCWLRLIDTHLH
ncbi:hypothetical protein NDU88_010322 [Pleurodeles waltl]|uniref:Uncharacterized protein n=1 Tax=Pleurodeles waltl TaxID=8319 RepID=A0AAV7R062_PLEWA|nr:hypothetical protein NDU88_010322 [Pleurodeles waltl]